jgi:hypothetical protein
MLLDKPSNKEGIQSVLSGQGHLLQEAADLAVDAEHLEILVSKARSSLQLAGGPLAAAAAAAIGKQMQPVQRQLAVTAYNAAAGALRSWQRGKALVAVGLIPKKELKIEVVKLGDPILTQLSGAASSKQETQNKLKGMRTALDALTGRLLFTAATPAAAQLCSCEAASPHALHLVWQLLLNQQGLISTLITTLYMPSCAILLSCKH